MIYINSTNDALDRNIKKVCAPLFASDEFLLSGHNENTTNATATFIKFKERIYAVTCHHVLAAFLTEAYITGRRLVPSIHSGHTIQQFYHHGPQGEHRWSFSSCRDFPTATTFKNEEALNTLERQNASRPDIAIADISGIWPTLQKTRDAEAIDLDTWVEPDWSTTQAVWLAYGYPNEHKYNANNMVAVPMPRVAVELASPFPSLGKSTYILCSTLEAEHEWGFSGLSGGPALVAHITEDRYAYVGITFEGSPSSNTTENLADSIFNKRDIILKGYHLTPTTFSEWLSNLEFGVELA